MSRVGPLLSPLLVGRDDLLVLADRRLSEAVAGRGQLLLLAGEAGVGKTRLLQAIHRKANAAGIPSTQSDLAPHDRQVPLASFRDLARTMRVSPGFESLGSAVTGILGRAGPADVDTLGARRLIVVELAETITAGITEPRMIAFEDLQWADEMSLEVIGELARIGRERPMLMVGSYRIDEFPLASMQREWRARLLAQRLAEEARLAALTYDETALVTTLILDTGLPAPREVVNAVYERTDGIPLHIEELLGALGDDARRDGDAIRSAQVPDTIEDAILARYARLSDDARAVARAGAVIGRCFVPDVLAGVMNRSVAELDWALEELVANSFLYPFDYLDKGFFDFRHQLLRDALYGTIAPADLRRLEARAGEFGAELIGATEIHASVHFERAGLRPQAFRAALAGAEAAASVSGRREAFELYQRAVANVPDGLSPLELGNLYEAYVVAAAAVDRVGVVIAAADEARRHFLEAGRPVEAASMLVWQAGMGRRDARPIAGRFALLDQADEELADLPASPERTLAVLDALSLRAVFELERNRLDEAQRLLAQAHAMALASGDDELVLEAEYWQRIVDVLRGRIDGGLEGTLGLARRARDAGYESAGVTAYRNAAVLGVRIMDYASADVGIREGMRYADEIEQSYCRHVMSATSALVHWAAGRWDEAQRVAAQELVEPASRRGGLGSRDALAFVAFGRGDVDRARDLLDASLEVGRESGEIALVLQPMWGLAETALVAGDPELAVEWCEAALSLARETAEQALLVPFVVTGVRARQATRRPEAAEQWLADVREHLEAGNWTARAQPALDHADGLVRLAAGSTVSARTSLEVAVRGWDEVGRVWESSWARIDLAACLIRGNRHLEAVPVLAEVRRTAEALGSGPLRDRVIDLGGIARRRGISDEPWRPLSMREFEVARHVAAGLTNAEIADQLGLSPKTISAHIEHILAKLGATRRAEIASWVALVDRPFPAERLVEAAGSGPKPGRQQAALRN